MRVGDQTLEFLTFTPDHADSRSQESRRLVRSHAIRDAIRRRRVQAAPGYKQAPVKRAAEVSKPLSEHTGRFRLNTAAKPSRKKNGTKKQDARKKEEVDEEPIVVKLQQDDSSTESLALDSVWDQGRSSISDFAGGALDPFEILPVKYGRRHKALHLYNDAVYRTNSFAFYPNQLFVSYAATDSAWLSATLSLITLYYDLRAGGEVSQECLFHRGEALRIVNERLSTSPEEISDGTIGAVAVLAHFDTTNGSHRSAATHFKGLVQMVSSRGGLLALEQNNLLQKTVGWADLCYSSSTERVPRFPVIKNTTCAGTLEAYLADVAYCYDINLKSSLDLMGEMAQIFQSMRFLSYLLDNPAKQSSSDQERFTRGSYIVGYRLVTVLDPGPGVDEEIFVNRCSHVYGSCRLAATLYLYHGLRELPRGAQCSRTTTLRLCSVLRTVTGDVLIVWQDDLFLLLWIAFMGASATPSREDRVFLICLLARTASRLQIECLEDFRSALRSVLWNNEYGKPHSSQIWTDMAVVMGQSDRFVELAIDEL